MQAIQKYFGELSQTQVQQFEQLGGLYREWNDKINVISRKDIDNLYTHHVLHSLALPKVFGFVDGAEILDLGTGGGFPGIPLAIYYPNVKFLLVDSIAKKTRVAAEIAEAIGLKNVKTKHSRAENLNQRFDFVITRAVASFDKLDGWCRKLLKKKHLHSQPNGIWAYKGQTVRLQEEIAALGKDAYTEIYPIKDFFDEAFFETKCLVYAQGH